MTAWWYRLIPAWAPSWLVEILSGLLAVAAARIVSGAPAWLLLGATTLSVVYETQWDPNGWSLTDVAQREVGIALGVLLAVLL